MLCHVLPSPGPHQVRVRISQFPSVRSVVAVTIALPVVVPIAAILLHFFLPASDIWTHLRETVLIEYIVNTLALLLGVAAVSGIVGVGCAWLTATKEFLGHRIFAWILILPLAAPAYVVAYAYGDLFSYTGLFDALFKNLEIPTPSIRSLPGAILVLGFTLYPYVYLLAFNAFTSQAAPLIEAARTLGVRPRRAFFTIALPHARPAIAGGLALALMETAADFGVVNYFGVPTLTQGIFRTWYAMGEPQAAIQLAGWLFAVAAFLVLFEQLARRGSQTNPVSRNVPAPRSKLNTVQTSLAVIACSIPLLIGLVIPFITLAYHTIGTGDPTMGAAFFDYIKNTVAVAAVAAGLTVACALCLTYTVRIQSNSLSLRLGARTATLGYAIPGMVLAIGLIGPLTSIDRWLATSIDAVFDVSVGLLLTGSFAGLILVYLARFLTVAFNSLEGGMAQIHPNYDDAARTLGAKPQRVFRRIHLPLLIPAFSTALLLVFVDVVKELPATLILRPFNFETLATRAYRLASDERFAEASTSAILIVCIGLVPTFLLALQHFNLRRIRAQSV